MGRELPQEGLVQPLNHTLLQVQQIVGDELPLVSKKIDLPELQGSPEDVSREKCKLAAQQADGPVMPPSTTLPLKRLELPSICARAPIDRRGNSDLACFLARAGSRRGHVLVLQCT